MIMINLRSISKVFLLKSKALSLSCISSVMIATVLIISMLNLTMNAETSYENEIRSMYGDIDIIATYEGYLGISETSIQEIKDLKELNEVSTGYFDPDFMIEKNMVYLVGSDNSNLSKSRYHYKIDLLKDEIAVNSVLADCLRCKVNDTIKISGINYRVKEIIEDVSGSVSNLTMAILNQAALPQIFGETPESNFLLISVNDNYKMDYAEKCISSIDGKLNLNVTQADEWYKDSVESYSTFIKALAICVVIVTGLFVASTMRRFIYKYNHDMAIIRAIGGSKKQVKLIFQKLVFSINMIGCIGGFLISVLLNKIILRLINKKIQLVEGDISFFFQYSLITAVLIFVMLTIILLLCIRKSFKVLPLEAFMENELSQIGKGNMRSKGGFINHFSMLLGKDTYITIKTMLSRFKENFLLTGTIMIIVVISFIGSSLSSIIQKNNNEYLKQEYLTDIVVTSSSPILYNDIEEYCEQLKNTVGVNTAITLIALSDASYRNEPLSFMIADFDSMQKQGIIENAEAGSNRIILSKKIADKFNISIGDYIYVFTPPEYKYDPNGLRVGQLKDPYEVQMCVEGISPGYILRYRDALIDINSSDFFQKNFALDRIYVSGDLDSAEQILSQIKNRYPGIKWSNYEEVKEISNKALRERFVMFEVVVCILVLVAGMGWVNAIRHTILSRKNEYNILRMHGMTIARLRKMLFMHILIYLIIGIALGVGVGIVVLMLLTYFEGGTSLIVINFNSLALITAFLIVLNLLLIPDVLKVSKMKVVMSD